ncbi:HIT-like protein [Flagelloscypha sp. PMI_526]|nr:HIT-like protein [Flagelloscypha sp. PMI_526]
MSSNLTILRKYAQTDPSKLPSSVLFSHNASNIVIFDAFPKAHFHFLVLPRLDFGADAKDLSSLRNLLKGDKEHAKKVIEALRDSGNEVCEEIEKEMQRLYGWIWPIRKGFHAVPSMDHIHLHIISDDYVSDKLKHKKHYNSFHPKLGFFLDVNDVLGWFDAHSTYYQKMATLEPKTYEPLLKSDLVCWRCDETQKNMPTLKVHLKEHFDTSTKRAKARAEKKRKADSETQDLSEAKRAKSETVDADS